jgi:hypothetical protein
MVAPTRLPSGVTVSYGLGVRLGSLQGHDLWGHTGGHAGIIAVAARYPNDELTIVIQINTVRSDFDALVLEGQIAATILGLNQEPPAPSAPASRQLEAYAGEYIGVPGEPSQIITVKDGLLSVASSGSESGRRLLPLARDTFFRESDPYPMDRYVFETVGGRVEGYSAFYNGFHGAFYQRLRR